VVREESGGIRRYCHIGTGNYNRDTARVYEDLGLLTSDPALGADVGELFNSLTGYSRQARYRKLLVAPDSMRPAVLRLIRRETERGEAGRIVIKVNNLVDPEMIGALCLASQAGVQIDLIVRSICCLRPGVPGLTENIRSGRWSAATGALPHPSLRPRRQGQRLLHQLGRPDAAQPGPARGGRGPHPRSRAAGPPRRGPGHQPE